MRKYQPIWEQLKLQKKAIIIAPPVRHKAIIKGVKMEKYNDLGFKVLQAELGNKYMLEVKPDAANKTIEFKLKSKLGIALEDL